MFARSTGCGDTDRFVGLIWSGRVCMLDRITAEIDKMGGVACIRGLRIPVATVVGMVADRMTVAEILQAYPDLESEDITQALRYAAALTKDEGLVTTRS